MRPSYALLALLAGCYPPPPVYQVQRSARVPRPTVPLRTGQPLAGPVELTLGMSSVADTKKPLGNTSQALELPTHQARGELRFRLRERGEIAAVHERAFGRATKLDETQADVDSGQPHGTGLAFRYSIAPDESPFTVGLDFELLRWSVPFTEFRTCVENCENVDTFQESHSASNEATFGFGITPAYRIDHITLFGGLHMRNHPTIIRKGSEIGEHNDVDTEAGPVNLLFHAGVALRFSAFTALVLVHHNRTRDPVNYGPGIGFALSATIDPSSWSKPSKIDQARERMRAAQARRR